jgi:hypothetical protein
MGGSKLQCLLSVFFCDKLPSTLIHTLPDGRRIHLPRETVFQHCIDASIKKKKNEGIFIFFGFFIIGSVY